jgi:hypothetical protein
MREERERREEVVGQEESRGGGVLFGAPEGRKRKAAMTSLG